MHVETRLLIAADFTLRMEWIWRHADVLSSTKIRNKTKKQPRDIIVALEAAKIVWNSLVRLEVLQLEH